MNEELHEKLIQYGVMDGLIPNLITEILTIVNKSKEKTYQTRGLKSTKFESYLTLDKGEAEEAIQTALFLASRPMSRQELANDTGISINTVCGAVSRLQNKGLVIVSGIQINKTTGRKNETLQVVA